MIVDSAIIGTGISYVSDKSSNRRQFMHCLLAMLSSSSSAIRLEDLLLADRCGMANNPGALQHSDSAYTLSLRNSTHLRTVNEGVWQIFSNNHA